MAQDMKIEIAALRRMTAGQLRQKYLEFFGEPTRSGNREFLFKRLAWQIQSLVEGGLSDRARQRAAELARDTDLRTAVPRSGEVTAESYRRVAAAPSVEPSALPIPGTVLTRPYRGRLIEVTVLPKGFEWEGEVYRSLSAVAKAVTGAHWNGRLFFGLKDGSES